VQKLPTNLALSPTSSLLRYYMTLMIRIYPIGKARLKLKRGIMVY